MIAIDYSSVGIVQIMGALNGDTNKSIDPSGFRNLMLHTLREYRTKYGARFGEIVIAVDNERYWRREVYPTYKCTRKKAKEDAGFDWVQINHCLDTFEAELREFFPYPVVNADLAEADDVIAVLAEWSQSNDMKNASLFEGDPKDFLAISADGDICQTQKYKNVKQISPMTKLPVYPKMIVKKEKVKVPLEEYVLDHILVGDSTDAIPNILTGDDFFRLKEENPETTYRQKPVTAAIKSFYQNQRLVNGEVTEFRSEEEKILFERNRKLISFDCIPDHVKTNVITVYENQLGKDRSHLMNYFMHHGLRNLIDDIGDF